MIKKEAVLIFGVFNPVTKAHVSMGFLAKLEYPCADIVYIPTRQEYITNDKGLPVTGVIPESDRVSLLIEATREFALVDLCEVHGVVNGKTYDTVQHLSNIYDDIVICLGADKLCELDTWYQGEDLVKQNRFLIITRNGNKGKLPQDLKKYQQNFKWVSGAYQEVSSTAVRECVKSGKINETHNYVQEHVYDYICEHPYVFM